MHQMPLPMETAPPISQDQETRLASPCNIFAKALSDVKALARVQAGARIKVTLLPDG